MTYIPKQQPLSWMQKAKAIPQKKCYSDDFYAKREWKDRLRKQYISKNPFCVECAKQGLIELASVVDHVIPIRQGGAAKDESNYQSLCKYHHDVKRGKERHGFILPFKFNHNGEKIPQ